ncbi:hypothetical protein [Streptomyces sp. NPDC053728]|uniref:hypothetical protein n=1 Tax=Streptomyces sp. NPDC053728 TaxID=3155534 RepID=UPI00341A71FB
MAKDVDRALRDIAVAHAGLQEDAAAANVKQLAADKRYVRDVYRAQFPETAASKAGR